MLFGIGIGVVLTLIVEVGLYFLILYMPMMKNPEAYD
jgi:hypothetical protein